MNGNSLLHDIGMIDRHTMLKTTAASAAILGPFAMSTPGQTSEPTCEVDKEVVELTADVCVIGGGSGGIGAAIAATSGGANIVLVEGQNKLGGTSTLAFVCNWEPGPGDSIAREIYKRMAKIPNAVGITSDHNDDRSKGRFGLWLTTPNLTYEQTLRRAGLRRPQWHGAVFEPDVFHNVVTDMLSKTDKCRTLSLTKFVKAEADGRRVQSITAISEDGTVHRIRAHTFIDCTGGAHVCRAVGCNTMLGPESKSRFDESSAPEKPRKTLNAISLCYRVRKSDHPIRQAPPEPSVAGWAKTGHIHSSPNGDMIVNPLPILPGVELINMGYEKAMAECKRRVLAHWHWLQSYATFSGYEFDSFAPMLGIRESYRVVGEYVLTQHDLLAGLEKQTHPDIIATADHNMDVHGAGGHNVYLEGPYGIPFRCLIPKGWENLLVACRGASFSHIAASSCRLSRTMISLGHAAGAAAAMAAQANVPVVKTDVSALQMKIL